MTPGWKAFSLLSPTLWLAFQISLHTTSFPITVLFQKPFTWIHLCPTATSQDRELTLSEFVRIDIMTVLISSQQYEFQIIGYKMHRHIKALLKPGVGGWLNQWLACCTGLKPEFRAPLPMRKKLRVVEWTCNPRTGEVEMSESLAGQPSSQH